MAADGLLSSVDVAGITSTVSSSLDLSLALSRNTGQGTSNDGYGHSTQSYSSQGNIACTVSKPTASVLQSYANIIQSKRALTLRAMATTDIRQLDHVTFDSLTWVVQAVLEQPSYTVTKQYLMTVQV